jgi:hypothetical protein
MPNWIFGNFRIGERRVRPVDHVLFQIYADLSSSSKADDDVDARPTEPGEVANKRRADQIRKQFRKEMAALRRLHAEKPADKA